MARRRLQVMPKPGSVAWDTALARGVTKKQLQAKQRGRKLRGRPATTLAMHSRATRPSHTTTKVEMDDPMPDVQEGERWT